MRGPREQLVEQLRAAGVVGDPAIARALRVVPRHRFVPEVAPEQAYTDQVVTTKRDEHGRPISSASQPSMVALMLRQLAVRPGDRVLEIGSGTGYNAALLAELVGVHGEVTTVDLDPDTVDRASRALTENGYAAVRVRHGDGGHGVPEFAPYDRIIVTAGAADLPPAWWRQLTDDGLLVVPLTLSGIDVSAAFRRHAGATPADERLASRSLLSCGFMPMRGAFGARGEAVELATGVRAMPEDGRAVRPESLRAAAERPAPVHPTGVSAAVGELLRGLDLWLTTTDPAYCRIELDAEAVRAGALASPLLKPNGDGRLAALLEEDSVAVLSYTRIGAHRRTRRGTDQGAAEPAAEPAAVAGCPVDDPDTRVELGVAGYGPRGIDLCNRLMTQVREWRRRDNVGPERMRVLALPAGTPVSVGEDVHVIDKPHCRLAIRWQ